MNYSLLPRLLVAAALLSSTALASCHTGNDTGENNTERNSLKNKDSDRLQTSGSSGDSATSGTQPNSEKTPSTREVYEQAADRVDHQLQPSSPIRY